MLIAASLFPRAYRELPSPTEMNPSQSLRNCKTFGCTYREYCAGSEKCLSCLKGIKTGPFGSGAGAGAPAHTSPPAQASFQSMFSATVDLGAKGLRLTVSPTEINGLRSVRVADGRWPPWLEVRST